MGRTVCKERQCLYKGALFVEVTVVYHLSTVIVGGQDLCLGCTEWGHEHRTELEGPPDIFVTLC